MTPPKPPVGDNHPAPFLLLLSLLVCVPVHAQTIPDEAAIRAIIGEAERDLGRLTQPLDPQEEGSGRLLKATPCSLIAFEASKAPPP